jgi:cytosine/uracil/thiamine/allantoin permease
LMHRAPMFFSAFCWALSVIATNISANTTAVGNDLMLAFPRYINIRRVGPLSLLRFFPDALSWYLSHFRQ